MSGVSVVPSVVVPAPNNTTAGTSVVQVAGTSK